MHHLLPPYPSPLTPHHDADQIADGAEQRIYDVARREDKEETALIGDLVNQAMSHLEAIQNRESAYTGLPTGFRDLDDLTSGFQPGNLIVIAARPGVGKSSLAMNIAANVAKEDSPVAAFSLEMSRYEIGMRLLCAEANVPWDRIRNKRVGPDDWTRIVAAGEKLHEAPLHIVDAGNVNIVDIRAKARRMKTGRQGLELIIVDYLQLVGSEGFMSVQSGAQFLTTGAIRVGGSGTTPGGAATLEISGGIVDIVQLRIFQGGTVRLDGGTLAVETLPVSTGSPTGPLAR